MYVCIYNNSNNNLTTQTNNQGGEEAYAHTSSSAAAHGFLQPEPVLVCLKIIKNNKDFFDQSLDEIKLLQYLKDSGDPDEHHFLRMYDYFYYKVR